MRGVKERQLDPTGELNQFLATMERRAFTMSRFATGDTDDALDLVQDAMCDFVRRYSARPAAEWGVLFHRVLQSRITDWHRRNIVRRRFRVWFSSNADGDEGEDRLQNLADPAAPGPAELLSSRDTVKALEKALAELSLRQRQAFLLRAWEGLDVAQTATAMGCSEGSVKTHYSRAIHALRDLLEEYRR